MTGVISVVRLKGHAVFMQVPMDRILNPFARQMAAVPNIMWRMMDMYLPPPLPSTHVMIATFHLDRVCENQKG